MNYYYLDSDAVPLPAPLIPRPYTPPNPTRSAVPPPVKRPELWNNICCTISRINGEKMRCNNSEVIATTPVFRGSPLSRFLSVGAALVPSHTSYLMSREEIIHLIDLAQQPGCGGGTADDVRQL